jgi:hydrogenase maturation protein HypF
MVVTSGNVSDEPIVTDEAAAIERLRGIADWYLTHDRPIRVRCEDSVVRVQCGFEQSLRRSRGYAPLPISLFPAFSGKLLAVGGHLKNVFALSSQGFAVLSHHLGDLGDVAARRDLCNDIALYEQLFSICPQLIVHDQHPEYGSTLYAQERAHRDGIPLLSVQHHHAHLASCMAENQLQGEVLGVVFDGSGLGDDGTVWGGEFLLGGYSRFRRVACLRPVLLPGGDEAARQIWRIGLSYQRDANCDSGRTSLRDLPEQSRQVVETMMERDLHSPMTSSAGRLFDAVAAIVGLRHSVSYEGQAALELESLARDVVCDEAYPFRIDRRLSDLLQIDTRPMIAAIVDDMEQSLPLDVISRQFHNTVVQAIVDVCQSIRRESGVNRVVLSGGVMVNTVLSSQIDRQLGGLGFEIYMHRRVPPNDGGLCLGQLAVAAHAISMGEISV